MLTRRNFLQGALSALLTAFVPTKKEVVSIPYNSIEPVSKNDDWTTTTNAQGGHPEAERQNELARQGKLHNGYVCPDDDGTQIAYTIDNGQSWTLLDV